MGTKTEILPTPAEVLDNAADIMEEWGLAKNTFLCRDGGVCEEGAVAVSAGWHVHFQKDGHWWWVELNGAATLEKYNFPIPTHEEIMDIRMLFIRSRRFLIEVGGGPRHNDRINNTVEQSVAKLREAAEYARTHS
jgi:hypothetical protein